MLRLKTLHSRTFDRLRALFTNRAMPLFKILIDRTTSFFHSRFANGEPLRFKTLRSTIIVSFLGLFTLVQILTFYSVYTISTREVRTGIYNDLAGGLGVIDLKLKSRAENLSTAAEVLSRDYSFKTVFASRHRPTLLSAMKNQATRIQADVMLLVSLKGMVIEDTAHPGARPTAFPLPNFFTDAGKTDVASTTAYLDDKLYHLTAVPLRAPLPVAWIVFGFKIDDTLARELKMLTALDVTFTADRPGQAPAIAASSLSGELRDQISAALRSSGREPDGTMTFVLNDEQYLGMSHDLSTKDGAQIKVLMQRSMAAALKPYYRIRRILVLLFIGGVAVTLILGVVVSSFVTKPVRVLVEGARIIEQGDYTRTLPVLRQDEIGSLTSAFNHMQTAIAEREERIGHQAFYDALTDLPNRSFLDQKLQEAISKAREENRPLALILLNINRFISVIATLGHETGNAVLLKISVLLRDSMPPSAIVARMGGDVFALMVPGEDDNGALRIVNDIATRLEAPIWVEGAPIQIEARFGIVTYPVHGDDANTLQRRAEVALHLARSTAHGFAVYSPDQDRHSIHHLTLLSELRHAIDNDELVLHYQPKIHFASRRIIGVEALIRWRHPQHGFIPPDDFIPLSEGTGLIKPVTFWALKTAIRHCAQLFEQGIHLNVAINLSARVLPDHQLPDAIASFIDEFQLSPLQISLEITESAIMIDRQRTLEVITRLDSLGVQMVIDDFGTGYSSLAYLKNLPIDEIKIDKAFVQKMDVNENDAMIVRSIIELGHNLGYKVTAEGVETDRIYEMLRERGCDVSQGYLHGKAMPLEELMVWLEQSPWGRKRPAG
jgi:diguanylate cyclase (GGDEF)-like protein